MVDRERLKLGQGFDLCLAVTFQSIKLDLKVWVGLNDGWVDGGGSMRIRDGSAEDKDKGWVGGVVCMRRWGCVSRGGYGHHWQGWV